MSTLRFAAWSLLCAGSALLMAAKADPSPDQTPEADVNVAEAKTGTQADETQEETAKVEDTPVPEPGLPAPSASWIKVSEPTAAGEDTIAMLIHARGQARIFLRKLSPRSARTKTEKWLRGEMRNVEVFDHETPGAGLERVEFSFEGWQGPKAMAGLAGIYTVDDAAYVIVATCDKDFFEKHEGELQRVLSEFRAK